LKKFPSKSWNKQSVQRLLKTEDHSSVDRRPGSETKNCA